MIRLALSVALTASLAGCTGPQQAQSHATPPEARTSMPQDPITPRRFASQVEAAFRHNSGMRDATRRVVRDAGEWGRIWPALSGSAAGASPTALPPVDFAREMALVAAMGRRNTGGYEIRIQSVERAENGLVVRVTESSPGPTCGTGAALSAPADVVVVPRSDLPVRWDVRQVVAACP
jgi:hypothetical protein